MSISKMSRSANQPVAVGSISLDELAAAVRRTRARPSRAGTSRTPAARKSQPSAPNVDRQRADRLVGIRPGRAPRARAQAGHGLDVEPAPVPEADVRDRDERGLLVDRGLEPLERDRPVGLGRDVLDPHAAPLLRVPDLPDRRELEVADDDLVAALSEAQARSRARSRPPRPDVVTATSSSSALIRPRDGSARRPRAARPSTPTARRARPSRRGSGRRRRARESDSAPCEQLLM